MPEVYGADGIVAAGTLLDVAESTSGDVLALNPQTLNSGDRQRSGPAAVDRLPGGYLGISDATQDLDRITLAG